MKRPSQGCHEKELEKKSEEVGRWSLLLKLMDPMNIFPPHTNPFSSMCILENTIQKGKKIAKQLRAQVMTKMDKKLVGKPWT